MRLHPLFAATVLFCQTASADIITFDFEGQAGADLEGLSTASTSSTGGSVTLTLTATANIGVFHSTSAGFGIDAPLGPSNDETDAFDNGANQHEEMAFTLNSNVPLVDLTLVSMKFNRFTAAGNDEFSLAIDGVLTPAGTYVDSDFSNTTTNVLTLNIAGLSTATTFDLIHVDGVFGLENIVFDATAATVPEPGAFAVLVALGLGIGVHRRCRKPGTRAQRE